MYGINLVFRRSIMSSYYRGAHAVILVYDVTNRNSFNHVENVWLEQVDLYCNRGAEHCVLMLLGNKTDLVAELGSSLRAVSVEEGMALAQRNGMIFAECSPKSNTGLNDAMVALADRLLTVYAQVDPQATGAVKLSDYPAEAESVQQGCSC